MNSDFSCFLALAYFKNIWNGPLGHWVESVILNRVVPLGDLQGRPLAPFFGFDLYLIVLEPECPSQEAQAFISGHLEAAS